MRIPLGGRLARLGATTMFAGLSVTAGVTSFEVGRAGAAGHSTPAQTAASVATRPSTGRPEEAPAPASGPAGDLAVLVPRVPPPPVIEHLCLDLVSGRNPEPRAFLGDLLQATGGTVSGTTAWCHQYLILHRVAAKPASP